METDTTNSRENANRKGNPDSTHLVESALHYATDRGWRVFPVYSVRDDGACTCGKGSDCDSAGKHPRIRRWPQKASTDPDVIRGWWRSWPNANVGIACGEESNLIVLDVDPRNGGDESLRSLENQRGALPHTLLVETGGGGRHVYFEYPRQEIQSCTLAEGLDLQSNGRFVVGPPSAHHTGGSYEWRAQVGDADLPELQPLPDWIAEQAGGSSSSQSTGRLPPPEPEELILEGERDKRLTSLAGHLRNLNLTGSEIAATLLVRNRERCRPPLDEKQVRKIARSIGRREVNGEEDLNQKEDDPFGFTLASEIEPEKIDWLWRNKIPLETVTLLVGDGGLGKSTLSLDLAARLTRGEVMPGPSNQPEPGRALILSTEDSPSKTIRPRLETAGADLDHVKIQTKGGVSFPNYLDDLERAIIQFSADLVIVDPITGFLGKDISMNDAQDVRRVLTPLKEIAEKTGCTFLLVVHLNQRDAQSAHHRILGSGDIVNAARSALVVAENPKDEERRVIAQVKSNLGPSASALSFRVRSLTEHDAPPRIEWLGESPYGPNDLLLTSAYSNAPTEQERAKVFIKNTLRHGPIRATEMYRLAAERGFSVSTLKRAKRELEDVESERPPTSFDDREWYWVLAEHKETFKSGEWAGGGVREGVTPLAEENGRKPCDDGPSAKEGMAGTLGEETQSTERTTKNVRDDTLGIIECEVRDYEPSNDPRSSGSNDHRDGTSPGVGEDHFQSEGQAARSGRFRGPDRTGGWR